MENVSILVEKSRNGDRDAFAQIIQQYQGMVSAVTLNVVGNYAQSEDLAQETFLTAWKKLPELREPEKLASWLYGIARRVALRWTEKHQRNPLRQAIELDADTMTDRQAQLAAADRQQREQSLELVWSTVKELPETLREPLLLYYRFSKSVADVAESLGLSEEAVRQRLSRGRKMLKAEVEKQVESVLESTGPSEHFTVAVLAALPIVLTGEQALAAGAAGAAAAQSASSGGASAGASLAAGVMAFIGAFVGAVLWLVFVVLGFVLGMWSGIRNAPTLRARQWMLKATLGYVIAGSLFFTLIHLAFTGMLYAEDVFLYKLSERTFTFLLAIIPVFAIVSSYFVNRRWRHIVEEDLSGHDVSGQMPAPKDFVRAMRFWVAIALFSALFAAATYLAYEAYRWWESYVGLMSLYMMFLFYLLMGVIILGIGISFFYYAVQISKDQESFAKYPPQLPNLLAILTGEEKAPKGFRNRINFWGDLASAGWGLFFIHMVLLIRTDNASTFVALSLVLTLYFLFAVFFAGIPRRRYWGMILLGVSVLLIDTGIHFMYSELPLKNANFVYGFSVWYLLCFTLLGVAGLGVFRRVFRRKAGIGA